MPKEKTPQELSEEEIADKWRRTVIEGQTEFFPEIGAMNLPDDPLDLLTDEEKAYIDAAHAEIAKNRLAEIAKNRRR